MGKSTKQPRHKFDDDFEYEPVNEVNIDWKKQAKIREFERLEKYEILEENDSRKK